MPYFSPFDGPIHGISFVDASSESLAGALDDVIGRLGGPADVLVVTAIIGGAAGVEAVNERQHTPPHRHDREEFRGFFGRRFSVGEPVIFGRNDYRAGMFNGLLGHLRTHSSTTTSAMRD